MRLALVSLHASTAVAATDTPEAGAVSGSPPRPDSAAARQPGHRKWRLTWGYQRSPPQARTSRRCYSRKSAGCGPAAQAPPRAGSSSNRPPGTGARRLLTARASPVDFRPQRAMMASGASEATIPFAQSRATRTVPYSSPVQPRRARACSRRSASVGCPRETSVRSAPSDHDVPGRYACRHRP